MRQYLGLLRALWRTRRKHRQWWKPSKPSHAEPEPWPEGFDPHENPVYARNRMRTTLPPEQLFRKLIRAEQWPAWYPNAIHVQIHRPPSRRITSGDRVEAPQPRGPEPVGAGGEAPAAGPGTVPRPAIDPSPGEGAPPELELHSEFSWTTFGIRVRSRVDRFVPDREIAWTAEAPGVSVYHRWFFIPCGEGGTLVVTEECEKGFLVGLIRRWMIRWIGHR